ncbi:MAG: stage II sporulation protein R [Desulfotomaculaceae bacterium]|nr:stage II sporulation protein R [Desulfotomaculaceae bacterium]
MSGKTKIILTCLFSLLVVLFVFQFLHQTSETIFPPGQLIRLHIVANSDCKGDQELKRKVRDEIIRGIAADFGEAESINTARSITLNKLDQIREIANREIRAEGKDYPVEVDYGKFAFPTKHYGPFILPAGDYESVQVVIGTGGGANWWCVLFPPLCFVDMTKEVTISPINVNATDAAPVENENFTLKIDNHDDSIVQNTTTVFIQTSSGVTASQISNTLEQSSSNAVPGKNTAKVEFRFRILDFLKCFIHAEQPKTGG